MYNNVFSQTLGNPSLFNECDLGKSYFFRLVSLITDNTTFRCLHIVNIPCGFTDIILVFFFYLVLFIVLGHSPL